MKFTTHLELHSQNNSTRRRSFTRRGHPVPDGFSPSMTARSRALRRGRTRSILCKLQLGPRGGQI
ncbi:hypothetical protein P170DRAFT_78801, partial [Aspergillus steynii IBT 23096]